MGFASAEPAPAALARPDEAEVARRADVLALTVQLRWLARSTWLLPTEALWAVLALRAGLPWPWVATALGLRLASHAVSHVQARRLQPLGPEHFSWQQWQKAWPFVRCCPRSISMSWKACPKAACRRC